MADLLIRGGTVVDGTGTAAFQADLRVNKGRVVDIGSSLSHEGERIIDAGGCYVTPGFLDTHTHLDPTLFWDRNCDPLPLHGVTTAVVGNCSLSLAPVRPEHREMLIGIFGYVEELDPTMLRTSLPWTWQTQGELQTALAGLGLNVAFLVGHTPLRLFVMGEDAWSRAATDGEIERLVRVLADTLRDGARGLSTSFFDTDADGRPVPSALADDRELGRLLDVLAAHDGVLEFIPNIRNADYRSDIARIGALCGPRSVRATWNGLFYWEDRPDFARSLLDEAAEEQERGVLIYPQVSPRPLDTRINWDGGMTLASFKESWLPYVQAKGSEKSGLLEDPQWQAAARREWDGPEGQYLGRRADRLRLLSAQRPEDQRWIGRTLSDLAKETSRHPADALVDWVRRNDGRPDVVFLGVGNDDIDAVASTLCHSASLISNSDAGAHVQTLCSHGDTTQVLTTFVRERGDFSIEQAVFELTSRQAEVFGLQGKGRIAIGLDADLVIFALDDLVYVDDEMATDLPGEGRRLRRPWGGYRYTVVAGTVVQENGHYTSDSPGAILGAP